MRLRAVGLGVIVLAAAGCHFARPIVTSTQLPAGFKHDGEKRVYLCAAGDDYEDQLALRAVQEAIKKYTGLFVVVSSADEAELVLQASGVQGRAAKGGGVGIGIGPIGVGSGRGNMTPSTELGISVSLKSTGEVIYQNLVVIPLHPNVGMPRAATKVFSDYASGH